MINTSDLMQKIGIHVGKFSEEVGWWRGDCSTLDSRHHGSYLKQKSKLAKLVFILRYDFITVVYSTI